MSPSSTAPVLRGPARLAGWSVRHPWAAIGLSMLMVVAASVGGSLAPTQQTTQADYRVGESGRADTWLTDSGLAPPPQELVHVQGRSGSAPGAAGRTAADDVRRSLAGVEGVDSVSPAVWSPRDGSGLVTVTMDRPGADGKVEVTALHERLTRVGERHPQVQLGRTGPGSMNADINERVADDLMSAEVTALPVTLLIMLLTFGALIAAGLPVLVGLTSVAMAVGLLGPISQLVPMEPTAFNMVVLIGMAVGVDYSLFYLKRDREERAAGRSPGDAVRVAAATSGHAIVVSGLSVMAALAGLYLMGDVVFTSIATSAVVVVAAAVVGSLTVLPALMTKLGRWVDRPRVPLLHRIGRRRSRSGRFDRAVAHVVRNPWRWLLASLALAAVMAVPASQLALQNGSTETLPQDIPAVQTLEQVSRSFPAQGDVAQVAVRSEPGQADAVRAALTRLAGEVAPQWQLAEPARTSTDGRVTLLELATRTPSGEGQMEAVRQLRTDVRDTTGPISGAQTAVGGDPGAWLDLTEHQTSGMPWVILAVLGITALVMLVMFRDLRLALITSALNLVSVVMAFGVLVLVFQNGWAEGVLGFESTGAVISWVPLFLFAVLVGLSMDYHVLVVSRIRENVADGMPWRTAIASGISRTAGVVTSAAVVMVSVFAIFASLSMVEMKQIGVGLSTAVLIDATLIRLVMLPAALALVSRSRTRPAPPPSSPEPHESRSVLRPAARS